MSYFPLIHAPVHYSHGRLSVPLISHLCVETCARRSFSPLFNPLIPFSIRSPISSLCYSATTPTCSYPLALRRISATLYIPPLCLPRLCGSLPPPLRTAHRFVPAAISSRTNFLLLHSFYFTASALFLSSISIHIADPLFSLSSFSCFCRLSSLRYRCFDFPQSRIVSSTFYALFPQKFMLIRLCIMIFIFPHFFQSSRTFIFLTSAFYVHTYVHTGVIFLNLRYTAR